MEAPKVGETAVFILGPKEDPTPCLVLSRPRVLTYVRNGTDRRIEYPGSWAILTVQPEGEEPKPVSLCRWVRDWRPEGTIAIPVRDASGEVVGSVEGLVGDSPHLVSDVAKAVLS